MLSSDRVSGAHLAGYPRTHASRVARHDKIIDLVAADACRLGWGICQEPAIPKPAGIRRLDLILDCQDTVIVLDVTIAANNADLYQAHQHKCGFYNQPGIRDWVSLSTNVSAASPTFSSVTLNWRGLLAPPSAEVIRTLGLSASSLSLLSVTGSGHYNDLLHGGPI